jgi:4-diphosphocytidyl-2-C-methyl-D-erythritol kinase
MAAMTGQAAAQDAISEEARAKVNLTLKLRGRATDGYHFLESLITFAAGVCDEVRLQPGERVSLAVDGPFAGGISGGNLLTRALDRLAMAEPRLRLGAVTLHKRLPVAAGIGGGSADAGALLRAVCRANPELAGCVDWMGIAASLGADVPVCFAGETALAWGVGERLIPVRGLPVLQAVLLNPGAPVVPDKTARVFRRLKASPAVAPARPPALGAFADTRSLLDFMRSEGNDLLPAVLETMPAVAEVRAALQASTGCLYAGLSGAGPTCFGVYASEKEAAAAAAGFSRDRPQWWNSPVTLGG